MAETREHTASLHLSCPPLWLQLSFFLAAIAESVSADGTGQQQTARVGCARQSTTAINPTHTTGLLWEARRCSLMMAACLCDPPNVRRVSLQKSLALDFPATWRREARREPLRSYFRDKLKLEVSVGQRTHPPSPSSQSRFALPDGYSIAEKLGEPAVFLSMIISGVVRRHGESCRIALQEAEEQQWCIEFFATPTTNPWQPSACTIPMRKCEKSLQRPLVCRLLFASSCCWSIIG